MINLSGKIALVTGASGDIGKACASLLHKLGSYVILSGTNKEKLNLLASELGGNCEIRPCDLRDKDACQAFIDGVENLDILVCNAGITKDMLAIKLSLESFEDVIDVNLIASFILNQGAIKKMMKARYGRIINISSIVGVMGNPGQSNYCASKAGIIGMSKSLALEVATRGITINCIAPGFIASNMTDVLTNTQKEMVLQKVPMKNIGKPEDIANMTAFLASDAASYITGQTMHVNGGMLMV